MARRSANMGRLAPDSPVGACIVSLIATLAILVALFYACRPLLPDLHDATRSDASQSGSSSEFEPSANTSPDFYNVVGPAVRDYDAAPGEIVYTGLDDLGRTLPVYGELTTQTRADAKARGRGNHPDNDKEDPSGWGHNAEVDVFVPETGESYHGWFWNRSHLIADSLGARETKDSWITGTRMQNVGMNNGTGGMAYTETMARDYLDDESNAACPLYYAAAPNYEGDELVPRSVTVDVQSCDSRIDERVIVDNAMPGYSINYMTGSFIEAR